MVRANKHWPSLFKRSNYQSSQQGINSPITGGDNGERTSQPPKPRWIATPEQVQILENIFNSGIMNPPREEIKKIREKLQEYGPVGDVNIFYWFQNRKARNKNKQDMNILRKRRSKNYQNITIPLDSASSSSYHYQNVSSNEIVVPNNIELTTNNGVVNLTNDSPNDSTIFGNQNLATDNFQTPIRPDFLLSTPPLFSFPGQFSNMTQQYDQRNILEQEVAMNMMSSGVTSMNMMQQQQLQQQQNSQVMRSGVTSMNMMQQQQQQQQQDSQLMSLGVTSNSLNDDDDLALPPLPPIIIDAPVADRFSITQFQGVGELDHFTAKCTVSINNEIVEVDAGPFNIRQIFGDGAVLCDSSGHIVLTNEWGVTLDSLQHGASYFLV